MFRLAENRLNKKALTMDLWEFTREISVTQSALQGDLAELQLATDPIIKKLLTYMDMDIKWVNIEVASHKTTARKIVHNKIKQ